MKRITTSILAIATALSVTTAISFAARPAIDKSQGDQDRVAWADKGGRGHRGGGERGPHGPDMPPFPGHQLFADGAPIQQLDKMIRFWDDEELVAELGLTESQIDLLEESYQVSKETFEATKGDVKDAYETLREVMDADSPDADAVNAAIDAATEAQNVAMKNFLGHRVVVKNVLTEDQEETLHDYRRTRGREIANEMRGKIHEFRGFVKDLLEDGSLSDDDWAQIDEKIADLPERMQEKVRERIQYAEENGGDMPPPPRGRRGGHGPDGDFCPGGPGGDFGPGGPGGPGGDEQRGWGDGPRPRGPGGPDELPPLPEE